MNNPENPQELFECFDEQGNIIEPKTRAEVHTQPLQFWHGVVAIWLVNNKGEILCTKRSEILSGNPGKWQSCVGGHTKAGTDYTHNVVTEVWEEVGIKIDPSRLFLIEKGKNEESKHYFESYVYLFNGKINDLKFNDGEVTEAKWWEIDNYWKEKVANPGEWCNGCNLENQERIKTWLNSCVEVLGVKVSNMDKNQALQRVGSFLNNTGQYKIFTPNPEMIVKAQKDEYFKTVLNSGDLNLCDGMGVQIFTGIKRIPGVDFMIEICRLAAEGGRSVYLLGTRFDEVVKKAAENLQKQFPNLKIVGYDKGPEVIEQNPTLYPSPYRGGSELADLATVPPPTRGRTEEGVFVSDNNVTIQQINQARPDILFVAFGMGKQEKWIYENLTKLPSVKVAMGVGGSFDFISGKTKRASLFLRQLGLEWVYRLWQEPRRIGRIFNATARFCYLVLKSKFI